MITTTEDSNLENISYKLVYTLPTSDNITGPIMPSQILWGRGYESVVECVLFLFNHYSNLPINENKMTNDC